MANPRYTVTITADAGNMLVVAAQLHEMEPYMHRATVRHNGVTAVVERVVDGFIVATQGQVIDPMWVDTLRSLLREQAE